MPERVAVYFDGFNLHFGIRQKGWWNLLWLDIALLATRLLRENQSLARVHYFTSRLAGPSRRRELQQLFLEANEALATCVFHFGVYQQSSQTCQKCGATAIVQSEKMTDVRLACQILAEAFEDLYDTAIVVSGDGDLSPSIEKVRALFPHKRILVAFPPERYSLLLKQAASGYFHINRSHLVGAQLPARVIKADGFEVVCPSEWSREKH
jgi:uncharacterized LabA/DUF88 family protein